MTPARVSFAARETGYERPVLVSSETPASRVPYGGLYASRGNSDRAVAASRRVSLELEQRSNFAFTKRVMSGRARFRAKLEIPTYAACIVIAVTLASCASVGSTPSQTAALSPAPANSISEVIDRMQAIDAALPENDGLKWFNYLYLRTTEAVYAKSIAQEGFTDAAWIERLDVVFANLYFDAVRDADAPELATPAWRPLLRDRTRRRVARVQFALAGMNAHIDRDLVFALLEIYHQDGTAPNRESAHYADFIRIDKILKDVQRQNEAILLVGTPLENGRHFAPLENLVGTFSVKDTRHGAWDNSQIFWRWRDRPETLKESLSSLDRATEAGSSALLAPVLP